MDVSKAQKLACIVCFVTVLLAVAEVKGQPSGPDDDRAKKMMQCIADSGLKAWMSESGMMALTRREPNLELLLPKLLDAICKMEDKFVQAATCFMGVIPAHIPDVFQRFYPRPESGGELVKKLCQHKEDINFKCIKKNIMTYINLIIEKSKPMFKDVPKGTEYSAIKEKICQMSAYTLGLIKHSFGDCGCSSVKLYTGIVADILYPPPCSESKPDHDHHRSCHNGASAQAKGAWLWNAIIMAAATSAFTMTAMTRNIIG